MTKICKLFTAIALIISYCFISTNLVNAKSKLETDSLVFDELSPEYVKALLPDTVKGVGDTSLTKDSIDQGLLYQDSMNNRRSGEIYNLISTSVVGYDVVAGKHLISLPTGSGIEYGKSGSLSISYLDKHNISLGASVTFSISYNRQGPSGTESVGGYMATHRYFQLVGSGTVTQYNYRVTDQYTGNVIRHETTYLLSNKTSEYYSVLGSLNASTGYLYYRSATTSNVKGGYLSNVIANWNSGYCWNYIGF